MKQGLSIRYKFLFVMSALLVICLGSFLFSTIEVFKADKTELIFDLTKNQVSNLSARLQLQLDQASKQFELWTALSQKTDRFEAEDLLGQDTSVVFISVNNSSEASFLNRQFQKAFKLSENFFASLLAKENPIPEEKILKEGRFIWNATWLGNSKYISPLPLLGVGRRVTIFNSKGDEVRKKTVVGYLNLKPVFDSLAPAKNSQISVANSEGQILWGEPLPADHPLMTAARENKVSSGVLKYKFESEARLGAFSKSPTGEFVVFSSSAEDKVFGAISEVVTRSLIFTLILLTLAFLAAVLLSRSLTSPLAALVARMHKVSEGDLQSQIPIKSSDETGMLAFSFNQMISDLRQSRDQLEEANRDLDKKVQERTVEIKEAQEALIRTTRLASVGEIAGRAAHEVLNPLTSIMTRAGLMERKLKTEMNKSVHSLNELHSAWSNDYQAGGFDKLVQDWKSPSKVYPGLNLWQEDLSNVSGIGLDIKANLGHLQEDTRFLLQEGGRISKIINGMRRLSVKTSEIKNFSAREIISECCAIMMDVFNQRNIEVKQDYQAKNDLILVDKDEFIQALTNMMRNSLQAISGQGQLVLRTETYQEQIEIYVEDSGDGISEENQKLLFNQQFTTKSSDEGTGLGLGISRRFVRSFGGDIKFVSSRKGHTVFCITVPLANASPQGVAA
jgi:signal transduction histidine kinase